MHKKTQISHYSSIILKPLSLLIWSCRIELSDVGCLVGNVDFKNNGCIQTLQKKILILRKRRKF